jgi:carboxymethylenebutenolidase
MNKNIWVGLIGVIIVLLLASFFLQKFESEVIAPVMPPDKTAIEKNVEMLRNENGVEVVSREVIYHDNVKGWYSEPAAAGNYPGVVMIHEWWGLNENIRSMADELARNGYRVLAVDLYRGNVATQMDQARSLSSGVNKEEALANMKSAVAYLRAQGAAKVASLGWCFGGGQSLQLSLSDENLDATIIYYGQLVTDKNALSAVDEPVLGIFGDQDASISTSSVRAFETALNELRIKNEIHMYSGVGHAFANPSGMNYAPNETKDAWNKTLAFLDANLK